MPLLHITKYSVRASNRGSSFKSCRGDVPAVSELDQPVDLLDKQPKTTLSASGKFPPGQMPMDAVDTELQREG